VCQRPLSQLSSSISAPSPLAPHPARTQPCTYPVCVCVCVCLCVCACVYAHTHSRTHARTHTHTHIHTHTYTHTHTSAQVSDAIQKPSVPLGPRPCMRPITNGRKPLASRTATMHSSVRMTHEKAPSACVIASKIWSIWLRLLLCEMRCKKSSESTLVCIRTPCCSKNCRSSVWLDKFPLCARARLPSEYLTANGCREVLKIQCPSKFTI
jgi:hypothetical protein